jgi:hypothetical protein
VNKWADYQCADEISDKLIDKQIDKQPTSNRQATDNTIRNIRNKRNKEIYNTLPVYDPSNNVSMSKDEEQEIMQMMKGQS